MSPLLILVLRNEEFIDGVFLFSITVWFHFLRKNIIWQHKSSDVIQIDLAMLQNCIRCEEISYVLYDFVCFEGVQRCCFSLCSSDIASSKLKSLNTDTRNHVDPLFSHWFFHCHGFNANDNAFCLAMHSSIYWFKKKWVRLESFFLMCVLCHYACVFCLCVCEWIGVLVYVWQVSQATLKVKLLFLSRCVYISI